MPHENSLLASGSRRDGHDSLRGRVDMAAVDATIVGSHLSLNDRWNWCGRTKSSAGQSDAAANAPQSCRAAPRRVWFDAGDAHRVGIAEADGLRRAAACGGAEECFIKLGADRD